MEALVRPFTGWDEWPADARSVFQRLCSAAREGLILDAACSSRGSCPPREEADRQARDLDTCYALACAAAEAGHVRDAEAPCGNFTNRSRRNTHLPAGSVGPSCHAAFCASA